MQYTIRTKNEELDEYLKNRAEIENMSVSKLIVELLERQMHKDKIKKKLNMI